MGSISRNLALILIVIIALSTSLLMLEPAMGAKPQLRFSQLVFYMVITKFQQDIQLIHTQVLTSPNKVTLYIQLTLHLQLKVQRHNIIFYSAKGILHLNGVLFIKMELT